jgi:phage terminase small subunit
MTEKKYEKAFKDYIQGMTYAQIAKKYHVGMPTVKSWYLRHWKTMKEDAGWRMQAVVPDMSAPTDTKVINIDIDKGSVKKQMAQINRQAQEERKPDVIVGEYSSDALPDLPEKEQRFVEEYMVDFDKRMAAIRAGYPVSGAGQIGRRLYDKAPVFAHIQVALAETRRRTGVNIDTTVRELARIAFSNPMDVVDREGNIRPDAKKEAFHAVQAIKTKTTYGKDGKKTIEREIKFNDKVKALELLARHQGMLIDNKRVIVEQAGSIDTSKMSTDALQKELEKQMSLAKTIDVEAKTIDGKEDK